MQRNLSITMANGRYGKILGYHHMLCLLHLLTWVGSSTWLGELLAVKNMLEPETASEETPRQGSGEIGDHITTTLTLWLSRNVRYSIGILKADAECSGFLFQEVLTKCKRWSQKPHSSHHTVSLPTALPLRGCRRCLQPCNAQFLRSTSSELKQSTNKAKGSRFTILLPDVPSGTRN